MSLLIEEKISIKGFEEYYRDYLKNYRKVDDDKYIDEALKKLQNILDEKKGYLFLAKLNNKIVGHISGTDSGIVFEVNSFYVKPESYSLNCGFELVKTITAKAFEIGYKHYRQSMNINYNREPTFEENLKNFDYLIFNRFGMIKELNENDDYATTLPEGYSFESFSIEKVDEIMQVIVDANPKGHTDYDIFPE
ncbi:MAG: GNAT family N-acetyltransferase, partial [Asgard group archaeon]|nr:GNAT family N-acetyltransferase [Asgard group archaeon]